MAETYNENKPKSKKKLHTILAAVLLAVLVVAGGTFAYMYFAGVSKDPNVLAMVGDEKITGADLNEKIYSLYFDGTPESPKTVVSDADKKKYLNELIDAKVVNIEAQKMGVTVSDEEVTAKSKERTYSFDTQSDIQKVITKKNVKTELLEEKLEEKVLGWKEGSYIMVNFTKNFASNISSTEEQRKQEDAGRTQKVKEDSDYAKQLISSISADIKSGKITFKEGMEKAKNDPRFGVEGYKPRTTLQSDDFTKQEFTNNYKVFGNEDITKKVRATANGKVSEPFVAKVSIPKEGDKGAGELKDGIWMIAKVDKGGDALAESFEDWFNKEKSLLKIKILDRRYASLEKTSGLKIINEAKAHWGGHGCGQRDHYGVGTGLSSSSAGLVVTTGYYDASGVWRPSANTVSVQGTNGGLLWTPSGAWTSSAGELNKNFATGSAYSYSGGSCTDPGFLVLGWGSTSGSGANGNFGNGWTLNCDRNPFTVWTGDWLYSSPFPYGGRWWNSVNGGAWGQNHGTGWFNVANGWTTWVNMSFQVKPAPPSCNVWVEPNPVNDGETSCVKWSTSNASWASYEAFKDGARYYGPVPVGLASSATGTCAVRNTPDRIFKLTVGDSFYGQQATCQTTLTHNITPTTCTPPDPRCPVPNPSLPSCSISINPNPVSQLIPSLLTWSTNGTSAEVKEGSTSIGTGTTGNYQVTNTGNPGDRVFEMTAHNSTGNSTCSTTLTVNQNTETDVGPVAP